MSSNRNSGPTKFYGNINNTNNSKSNLTDYGITSPFNSDGIISKEISGPESNIKEDEDFERVDIKVVKGGKRRKTRSNKRKTRSNKRKSRSNKRNSKRR